MVTANCLAAAAAVLVGVSSSVSRGAVAYAPTTLRLSTWRKTLPAPLAPPSSLTGRRGFRREPKRHQTTRLLLRASVPSSKDDDDDDDDMSPTTNWLPAARGAEDAAQAQVVTAFGVKTSDVAWAALTAASLLTLSACVFSAVRHALPGVNAALGRYEKLSPARVVVDALASGRCVTVRRRALRLFPWLFGDPEARKALARGVVVSTQSPILSDLALDRNVRAQIQTWRWATYALAHASLPHAALDAIVLRAALGLNWRGPGLAGWVSRIPAGFDYAGGRPGRQNNKRRPRSARMRLRRTTPRIKNAPESGVVAGAGGAATLLCLAPVGVYSGAATHVAWGDRQASRALGASALSASLLAAVAVSRLRRGERRGPVLRASLIPLLCQAIGNATTGAAPNNLLYGGLLGGLFFAFFAGPRYKPVAGDDDDDPNSFVLARDARDVEMQRKMRKFAPRTRAGVLQAPFVEQRAPLVHPLFALFLVTLLTYGHFLKAITKAPNALVSTLMRPGSLSGRTLRLPPRFSLF